MSVAVWAATSFRASTLCSASHDEQDMGICSNIIQTMLQTYCWLTHYGSNVRCNCRKFVCVCPSNGSTRGISLLPLGYSASCFQNPLWFCHQHASINFTWRVARIVAFLLEKSHLWFSCTWPLMAYYKPTILQLFQTDLEEGTTTFQRGRIYVSKQTDRQQANR
jgi:hypothetical protein